jgi:hypothetical protein
MPKRPSTKKYTHFDTIEHLDKVVGERCVAFMEQQDMISASTLFGGLANAE